MEAVTRIEVQEEKQKGKPENRPYYCDSLEHLKKYYREGNVSSADVSVSLQKFFNFSLEEASKTAFEWLYSI
jgi:hypothetical protein